MRELKTSLLQKGRWSGMWVLEYWDDPSSKAMLAPESGPFSFLGRRSARCLPFPHQPGCWRVRPPSLRGLLCGCGEAGDCGAAAEAKAPEAAPRESPARAQDREGGYRIYRGQCRTLWAGSLRACYRICPERCSPFWEWQCRDLITCLLGIAGSRGGLCGHGGGWIAFIPTEAGAASAAGWAWAAGW